jgi:hypothetical protein
VVPEIELATAMRTSTGVAARAGERAAVVAELPSVEAALGDGRVHGAHVDEVARVLRSLAPVDRAALLERVDRLVDVAAVATPAEFGRRVRQEAARVRTDDGMGVLERQRGACRATSRVNALSGMWELHAVFDPFTGACLSRRLEAATEALRHGEPIEHAPHDAFERAEFLRAHALRSLIESTGSGGAGSGRPEIVIVVNTTIDPDATRSANADNDPTPDRRARAEEASAGNAHVGTSAAEVNAIGSGAIGTDADAVVAGAEIRMRPITTTARAASSTCVALVQSADPTTSTLAAPGASVHAGCPASFDPAIRAIQPRPRPTLPDPSDAEESAEHQPRLAPTTTRAASGAPPGGPDRRPRAPDAPLAFSIDWGLPVEVPVRVLADLALDTSVNADIHVVVLRGGIILHAPGRLDLGRTTRLANRAQRRALRARYPTCVRPGCEVPFHKCHIHHIAWWRHGGRTDLDNLAPLCNHDHTLLHEQGWQLRRGPDGRITITLPDGTVLEPEVHA